MQINAVIFFKDSILSDCFYSYSEQINNVFHFQQTQ